MVGDEPRGEIVQRLQVLNTQIKEQMSIWHVFRNGMIYGIGFVIGSTILTALIVTIVLQFFGDTIFGEVISWIAKIDR